MISAILVLLLLPIINTSKIRSSKFRPIFGLAYWFLVSDFLLLGWIGQKPVENPYIEIGMGATIFYFLFLLILVPLIGIIESEMVNYVEEKETEKFNKPTEIKSHKVTKLTSESWKVIEDQDPRI